MWGTMLGSSQKTVIAGLGGTCVMWGGGWGVAVLLWCEGTP